MSVIDFKTIIAIAPHAKPAVAIGLANFLNGAMDHFAIQDRRAVYFLGQAAEETDGFHTLVEYASGREYEGRQDLGNINPGDGPLFKGRGIFQLTGRFNYRRYGHKLGVDLEGHPDFAALPQYAVMTAAQFWTDHGLNSYADRDDIRHITEAINGGLRGLQDRILYTERAAIALGIRIPQFV